MEVACPRLVPHFNGGGLSVSALGVVACWTVVCDTIFFNITGERTHLFLFLSQCNEPGMNNKSV